MKSLKVSSIRVMSPTFDRCRNLSRDAGLYVQALVTVMDEVQRQGTLVVDVPEGAQGLLADTAQFRTEHDSEPPSEVRAHPVFAKILAVIDAGAREFARWLEAGESEAVRRLGYALHVLPQCIGEPESFDPKLFAFSLSVAAGKWDAMSAPMQEALRALVGTRLADAVVAEVRRNPRPW